MLKNTDTEAFAIYKKEGGEKKEPLQIRLIAYEENEKKVELYADDELYKRVLVGWDDHGNPLVPGPGGNLIRAADIPGYVGVGVVGPIVAADYVCRDGAVKVKLP